MNYFSVHISGDAEIDFLAGLASEWRSFCGIDEGSASPSTRIADAAQAPVGRDLVSQMKFRTIIFYFSDEKDAREFISRVPRDLVPIERIKLEGIQPRDWNEEWKKSFVGLAVEPCWWIQPSWSDQGIMSGRSVIRINPGMGFGTGTHPTTQMALTFLGELNLQDRRVIDFGAGSGILSVASALRGAEVWGVEIDELAMESAFECERINNLRSKISWVASLDAISCKVHIIVANILQEVLEANAGVLISRLERGGLLFLTGLLEHQADETRSAYNAQFKERGIEPIWTQKSSGEWIALAAQI